MPEKSVKPAAKRTRTTARSTTRSTTRKKTVRSRVPDHSEIATRAYYIHLEAGSCDEVDNWLRAERELMAAWGAARAPHAVGARINPAV